MLPMGKVSEPEIKRHLSALLPRNDGKTKPLNSLNVIWMTGFPRNDKLGNKFKKLKTLDVEKFKMKKTLFIFLDILCFLFVATFSAVAEEGHKKPYVGSKAFERMKQLAGNWEASMQMVHFQMTGNTFLKRGLAASHVLCFPPLPSCSRGVLVGSP